MFLEERMPEQTEATAAPTQEQPAEQVSTPQVQQVTQPEQKERTYTKQEVVDMMKRRINRSHQAFFNRYKVKDLAEMDAAFGKISEYEKQIADLGVTNAGLIKNNAYLTHNINPERYSDIEAYFKGKDLKIDSDTLAQEVATHPEWLKVVQQEVPKTTIQAISPERSHNIAESEDEKMKRIFGV